MTNSVVFDTLDYVKMLDQGGVEHAEVHSASLSTVLTQNIYAKKEVDHMFDQAISRIDEAFKRFDRFEASLNRFDEKLEAFKREQEAFRRESAEDRVQYNKRFAEIELRLERSLNRYTITTVSILGTLIVVMSAISTFAHYIFH